MYVGTRQYLAAHKCRILFVGAKQVVTSRQGREYIYRKRMAWLGVMNQFEMISIERARELATEPGYMIVDLRSRQEYDRGHIENAINLPNGSLRMIEQFQKKNQIWVLYCRRGSLSFRLASAMRARGYQVMAVVGGYREPVL